MAADFLADLEARGLVQQTTSPELAQLLRSEVVTGYVGFDPTASSLHAGSLIPVLALVRLQRAGHKPIAMVGGGTGRIGDPSGKASERSMLSQEEIDANVRGIRAQLERFLDFDGPRAARLVDNADWLCKQPLVDFLRDIGKHFSVNAMIQRDAVQLRLSSREHGISYTEFSYALLQAFDFLEVFDRFGCRLQMGGSDQWGNIVDGCDLVRRLRGGSAFGLTMPLVTKADGSKFGKSESGNVWLDPARTRPFQFFQFWFNTDDKDVGRYLRFFTFLELERIAELEERTRAQPGLREGQKVLAAEVTDLVHGRAAREDAQRAAQVLFEGGDLRQLGAQALDDAFAGAPRSSIAASALGTPAASLATLLASSGLSPSKSQARQAIQSGAVAVNHEHVAEVDRVLSSSDVLAERFIVLRRGKKTYHVLELSRE